MLLLITKDLFFIPMLQSAAKARGGELISCPAVERLRVDQLPANDVTACIVDLSGVSSGQVAGAAARLREQFPKARLVAYGPHVQTERIGAARDAGFDAVLTRRQLTTRIERLMDEWLESN